MFTDLMSAGHYHCAAVDSTGLILILVAFSRVWDGVKIIGKLE